MAQAISSDLKAVALELRLAARKVGVSDVHLSEQRLLELADIVDRAALRVETQSLSHEVAAFTALGQRTL